MILEITKPEIASNEKKVNMSELIPAVNKMKELIDSGEVGDL